MLREELEEMTGEIISARAYNNYIEPIYMDFSGDKKTFIEVIKPMLKGFERLAEEEKKALKIRYNIAGYNFTYAEALEKIDELYYYIKTTDYKGFADDCQNLIDRIKRDLYFIY